MNPYDFVRLPERVERESVLTHHKLLGRNGRMRCRLMAITPIFIPMTQAGGGTQRFMTARYGGAELPIIPGSSIKGVIRCVAEAVSLSCIGLSAELFDRGSVSPNYRESISSDFLTCKESSKLCPACRIFGMVSNKSHFLGKVSFSDAHTEPGKFKTGAPIILKPLMEPKPRHTPFYRPNGQVVGRKFYFHHHGAPKTTNRATEYTKTVVPLEGGVDEHGNPRTVFEFDVSFANLTDKEYSLLLFALVLTEDMCHKIGGGKPLGLGTVKIKVTDNSIYHVDPQRRYRGLGVRLAEQSAGVVLTGDALKKHVHDVTMSIIASGSDCLKDLQYIWKYPPPKTKDGEPEDYKYPSQEWFRANPRTPIPGTP